MTIGVGFKCVDGIVLCSDTQITVPGSHTYYAPKISCHGPSVSHEWGAVFTFAGDLYLMDVFKDKFDVDMSNEKPPFTTRVMMDVAEQVLFGMTTVINSSGSDLFILGAFSVPPNDMRMVKAANNLISLASDYQYIGIGDSSLLRFLADLICKQFGPWYSFTTDQGVRLGSYLIKKAKQYVDGCGGDTEIFGLLANGHVDIHSGRTKNLERDMNNIEDRLQYACSMFFDARVGNNTLEQNVEAAMNLVKQHRTVVTKI